MEVSDGPSGPPRNGNRKCPECATVYPNDERFCMRDGFALVLDGAPPNIIGTLLGNKYRVERLIGSGAMGDVYQVRHVRLDQVRAVKKMHGASMQNPDAIERFRREAKQQSKIRHPNVATLYDFEEESNGGCFLVMEYVDGKPLADVIAECGRVPTSRVATIVTQMAAALDAAHEEGVVHRDLKPDNVLIASGRDGTDRVKVVDFGIATLIDPHTTRITSTGFVVGTPRYMSPEQLLTAPGETVDGRSDVYALGLVAMEMLLGFLPFGNRDLADIMKRAASAPPNISNACADQPFPKTLDPVFARALAIDRDARYSTAGEFAHELVSILSTAGMSPVAARLPSPTPLATPIVPRPEVIPRPENVVTTGTSTARIAAYASLAATLAVAAWLVVTQLKGRDPSTGTDPKSSAGEQTAGADSNKGDTVKKINNVANGAAEKGGSPVLTSAEQKSLAQLAAAARAESLSIAGDRASKMLASFNALPIDSAHAVERIATVNRLLPDLRTKADSVSAQLVIIEALGIISDDTHEICKRMPNLSRMSAGTEFAAVVKVYADSLQCRK